MIRLIQRAAPALLVASLAAASAAPLAFAKETAKAKEAPAATKHHAARGAAHPGKKEKAGEARSTASKAGSAKASSSKGGAAKSAPVGKFGDWDVFATTGKGKTCYTLARPKSRAPASLKRDDAYVFISNRPAEHVRHEVSVIMGFAMKDGSNPTAEIDGDSYEMVAKGSNAWLKNPAKEDEFVAAMKKGSKLVVKAASTRGHQSTDTYSLSGITDALGAVEKACR